MKKTIYVCRSTIIDGEMIMRYNGDWKELGGLGMTFDDAKIILDGISAFLNNFLPPSISEEQFKELKNIIDDIFIDGKKYLLTIQKGDEPKLRVVEEVELSSGNKEK
jgi:hypothetical protein